MGFIRSFTVRGVEGTESEAGAPGVGVSAGGLLRPEKYKKHGIGNTSPEFLKEIRAQGFLESWLGGQLSPMFFAFFQPK